MGLVFTLLRMAALVVLYVVLARILLLMGAQRVLTAALGATRVLAGPLNVSIVGLDITPQQQEEAYALLALQGHLLA